MRKLLNVLFVTLPDTYLSLENENVIVKQGNIVLLRVPLLNLEGIICFNYFGATPSLLGECAKRNITVSFLNEFGRYLGTLYGETRGNVLLRKEQYRISDNETRSLPFASCFIFGKVHNQKWVVERCLRDHQLRVDDGRLKNSTAQMSDNLKKILQCEKLDTLRAIEGNSAQAYFKVFDELILQNKQDFCFKNRNRRPPVDQVNALLSFCYTLLTAECRHALEVVGLDSYVGFLHVDRPGRASLALDLMEELRPHFVDRLVLSLINRKEIVPDDFEIQASGAVVIKTNAKKKVISAWQQRKKDIITHPFLEEKCEWGLIPYVQAILLSKAIRNELEKYPPFLWK